MGTGLSAGCACSELAVRGGGDAWTLAVTAERVSGFGDVGACVLVFGARGAVAKEVDGCDSCRSGSRGWGLGWGRSTSKEGFRRPLS